MTQPSHSFWLFELKKSTQKSNYILGPQQHYVWCVEDRGPGVLWRGRGHFLEVMSRKEGSCKVPLHWLALLISSKVITHVDHGELCQNSGLAWNYHGKKNKGDTRPYEPLCERWEWRGLCMQGSGKGRVTSFSGNSGLCQYQNTVKILPCLAL